MVAKPVDEVYDIDTAGADFPSIIERVSQSGRQVVLTRGGQPVAVIVSIDDAEAAREQRQARIDAALKHIGEALADVELEEIERQVKLAMAEVRAGKTS